METKKKPPSWGSVVGVLGICFGVLGLLGGTYELLMPAMFDMQKDMMASMREAMKEAEAKKAEEPPCPQDKSTNRQNIDPDKMFESMEKMWNFPSWYKTWAITNGTLQMLLAAAYVLAAIFLLIVKRGAPTLFMGVAGASMLRNIASLSVGLLSGSMLAFWAISSAAFGFLIDMVLIIVVAVSDRSVYFEK